MIFTGENICERNGACTYKTYQTYQTYQTYTCKCACDLSGEVCEPRGK